MLLMLEETFEMLMGDLAPTLRWIFVNKLWKRFRFTLKGTIRIYINTNKGVELRFSVGQIGSEVPRVSRLTNITVPMAKLSPVSAAVGGVGYLLVSSHPSGLTLPPLSLPSPSNHSPLRCPPGSEHTGPADDDFLRWN